MSGRTSRSTRCMPRMTHRRCTKPTVRSTKSAPPAASTWTRCSGRGRAPGCQAPGWCRVAARGHLAPFARERRAMIPHRVSLSCNANPYYLEFWEPVSRLWKHKCGLEPWLFFVGDENDVPPHHHGTVVRVPIVEGVPEHTQAQWARFFFTKSDPDCVWITSDIDMFPLSSEYFFEAPRPHADDCFVSLNSDLKDLFPVCYDVATGRVFGEVLELEPTFEESVRNLFASTSTYPHTVNGEVLQNWGADEEYASRRICAFRAPSPSQHPALAARRIPTAAGSIAFAGATTAAASSGAGTSTATACARIHCTATRSRDSSIWRCGDAAWAACCELEGTPERLRHVTVWKAPDPPRARPPWHEEGRVLTVRATGSIEERQVRLRQVPAGGVLQRPDKPPALPRLADHRVRRRAHSRPAPHLLRRHHG